MRPLPRVIPVHGHDEGNYCFNSYTPSFGLCLQRFYIANTGQAWAVSYQFRSCLKPYLPGDVGPGGPKLLLPAALGKRVNTNTTMPAKGTK